MRKLSVKVNYMYMSNVAVHDWLPVGLHCRTLFP